MISKIIGNQEKPVSNSGGEVLTSNPNLLMNPWFTVNQRGLSTYSGGSQYTADRWKIDYTGATSSVEVSSSGITINNTGHYTFIEQKFESVSNLLNRQLTASILFSDGTIKSGTAIYDGTASINFLPTTENVRLQMNYINNSFKIVSYSSSPVTVKAVKLEIGSTSTLHLDAAPDYTTELLKCQRYFVRFNLSNANQRLGFCWNYSANTAVTNTIILNAPMRTIPTLTYSGTFVVKNNGTDNSVSNMGTNSTSTNSLICISVITSGLTTNAFSTLLTSSGSAYIDLSAEL